VGNPPVLQLRVTSASHQPGLQVFNGIDPAQIPDNDQLRTQVIPLSHVDPEKARQLVVPVLDQKADITVNTGSRTLIVTDTNSRIRTAVSLLQVLEKQAAEKAGDATPPPSTSSPAR
jgi:type II secretory pathway component GspD/PulD (secretin)